MDNLTIYNIPRAEAGTGNVRVNLADFYVANSRMEEVKAVNSHKAPELLGFFNKAYLQAARTEAMLEYELTFATTKLNQIKAIILMDRMVNLLAEKGLTTSRNPLGSEDIREAVYNSDPECQHAKVSVDMLASMLKLVREYKKAFEMSYNAVKKIMGDSSIMGNRPNPNLIVPGREAFGLPDNTQSNNQLPADDDFFGTAR